MYLYGTGTAAPARDGKRQEVIELEHRVRHVDRVSWALEEAVPALAEGLRSRC
jgi:exonuclease VII small subunit